MIKEFNLCIFISLLIISAFFCSCSKVKNESVVIDTMEASTIESEEKAEEPTRVKTKDSIVGLYYCKKSGDTYVLNDDYSGLFLPKSGNSCTIDWYKTGNSVTVNFTGEMGVLRYAKT